jgi:hypothetical protein
VLYIHPRWPEVPQNPLFAYQLVRTLFGRPDLAKRVRRLELSVINHQVRHWFDCDRNLSCQCGFQDTVSTARRLLRGLGVGKESWWIESVKLGSVRAFAGVLLAIIPNLEVLHFVGDPTFYPNGERSFEVINSNVEDLFGTNTAAFDMSIIQNLSNLEEIHSNNLLDWPFLLLPRVKKVWMSLHDTVDPYQKWEAVRELHYPSYNITSLTMNLPPNFLDQHRVRALVLDIGKISGGVSRTFAISLSTSRSRFVSMVGRSPLMKWL